MASQQTWSISTLNISVYLIILSHLFRVPSLLDQSFLFGDKFFYYHFPLFGAFYVVPDENLVILGFAVVSSFSKTVLILILTLGLLKVAVLYISSPLSSIQRSICLTFLASSVSYSGLFKISSHFYLNCLNILWTSPGLIQSIFGDVNLSAIPTHYCLSTRNKFCLLIQEFNITICVL